MKVTEKDLIGDIKDFPIEIVQRMVDCQVEQGNEADVSVFQETNTMSNVARGFSWMCTCERYSFWDKIINHKMFYIFFERYPKQEPKPYPKVMLVWQETFEYTAVKRVVFMEKNGKFIAWDYAETIEDSENQINTHAWDFAQDIPELPEKVIIKENGIQVGGVELSIEELENILNELKNK